MRSRRHHVKSRHGCVQCKARRTKCDETRPVCLKCKTRGSSCSFSDDPNTLIFVEGPSVRKAGKAAATAPEPESRTQIQQPGDPSLFVPTPGLADLSLNGASPGASTSTSSGSRVGASAAASPPNAEHSPASPGSVGSGSTVPPGCITPTEIENMRLMRYYQNSVWKSLLTMPDASDTAEQHLLRDVTPDMALDYPYLLHSLLSVSAVHAALPEHQALLFANPVPAGPPEHQALLAKSTGSPDASSGSGSAPSLPRRLPLTVEALLVRADAHHARALALMGRELGDAVTPRNLPALFLTACMIASYGFTRACVGPRGSDTLGELAHVLGLLRGSGIIVRAGPQHISSMKPYHIPFPRDPTAPLPASAVPFFERLDALHTALFPGFTDFPPANARVFDITINGPDDGVSPGAIPRAYAAALRHMRHVFLLIEQIQPHNGLIVVPWAVTLPATVLDGFRTRHPLALGLAAAYGVVMHVLRRYVWIRDWGARVVYACAEALGNDAALVDWPAQVVAGRDPGFD